MPDIITQPHDEAGNKDKDYFENARRYDPTVRGILGSVLIGVWLAAFLYLLTTSYWYMGFVLLGLLVVFLVWPIVTNSTSFIFPRRPSK